ncbi:ATP-binding protein [Winogradskyella sp. A3E31]|uniref:ATP-binding protein n=1 Tax=Winogradskyella sp. A3E31 TaxID=3349637 RepID=UPI00398BB3D0
MSTGKIEALEKKFLEWVALCLGDLPINISKDFVLPDVMGYGTTVNEYITNFEEFNRLLKVGIDTRKELKNFSYHITPVFKRDLGDDNTVLNVSEILLRYDIDNNTKELNLRISTIFVYKESKWKVLHWHGSLGMDEEDGTWHQEEWKRENEKLQKKVDEQTEELKQSLEHLKTTQAQLIQSEKMASLGELTAGIAHEIQNPLNFVNNFSEVSNELIDEMNEELDNGDIEEAKAIATDVKQNLEKINHHGKRADSIVKGMLQHSRNSSGEKESTDINTLADEYMRLAYHGLRAKDKSFNAELVTNFEKDLKPINVVPQEIGRVILNLFTNAFYAVNEKKQSLKEKGDTSFKPTVTATTSLLKSEIIIKVKDNGNGIPKAALKNIFDPFFTTKPTGQGTGLGLSMSYDIIKNHGGQLNVNTTEGEFTEFTITLPIKN